MAKAKYYWAKRAAGLCIECPKTAPRPATHGILCEEHRLATRASISRAHKRTYYAKKAAGVCVSRGCHEKASDVSVRCERCSASDEKRKEAWRNTRRGRRMAKMSKRRRHRLRVKRGLCVRCNRELVTKTLCEVHRRELIEANRDRRQLRCRCTRCGAVNDHRAQTCRALMARVPAKPAPRPPLPDAIPLPLEHFATARTGL